MHLSHWTAVTCVLAANQSVKGLKQQPGFLLQHSCVSECAAWQDPLYTVGMSPSCIYADPSTLLPEARDIGTVAPRPEKACQVMHLMCTVHQPVTGVCCAAGMGCHGQ